jgi:catechol 2,3-dioxygenase-like lactoylglutathione lyase family enzyme
LAAGVSAPLAAALATRRDVEAQGRCMRGYAIAGCPLDRDTATKPIAPLFPPTGWRTVSIDHIGMRSANVSREAAFYAALMGWTVRSDDAAQTVLDIGDWGTVVLSTGPAVETTGRGRGASAAVTSLAFDIAPWDVKTVEAALRDRGLDPIAAHDGAYEGFRVKDPDGFDLQIGNGRGHTARRRGAAASTPVPAGAPPFASTGWKTVWLDHLSMSVSNYKASASFYQNLLGWAPTYDEGSQHELQIGDVGDAIIRGGNPFDPAFKPAAAGAQTMRVDHISFGITPWDTDGVRAALEQRNLRVQVDTSTGDDIHVAAFKSYHTFTPDGFNLQISAVTHDTRLTLSNAVRPK